MRRRTLLAMLATAPFATRALATPPIAATPLSYDPQGRPLAAVTLNGQGPFQLVIDTAAGGTVLSSATIQRLALTASGRARMQGASGVMETSLYRLDSVAIDSLRRDNINATELPADSASSSGHEGVLGIPVFASSRLTFDFAANMLRVDANGDRAPLAGAGVAPINLGGHGMFSFTQVRVGGVEATALVDTGARRCVANGALRAALGFTETDPRLREAEPIGGATAHRTPAVETEIASIEVAGHDFGALNLAFANLSVFAAMHRENEPTMILGVDVLRRAQALTLDYSSAQMQLRA